jgi:hypothetical protein
MPGFRITDRDSGDVICLGGQIIILLDAGRRTAGSPTTSTPNQPKNPKASRPLSRPENGRRRRKNRWFRKRLTNPIMFFICSP